MESELKENVALERQLPERKSFRLKQKAKIEQLEAKVRSLEAENLTLVEKVDISDQNAAEMEMPFSLTTMSPVSNSSVLWQSL